MFPSSLTQSLRETVALCFVSDVQLLNCKQLKYSFFAKPLTGLIVLYFNLTFENMFTLAFQCKWQYVSLLNQIKASFIRSPNQQICGKLLWIKQSDWELSDFWFDVKYSPGKANIDTLSTGKLRHMSRSAQSSYAQKQCRQPGRETRLRFTSGGVFYFIFI